MKALISNKILFSRGIHPGCIIIDGEKIAAIYDQVPGNFHGEIIEFENLLLMPGLVDCHVHINEPGRTEWEGFESATQSAAAGGITTVIDMPLNCLPVTTSAKALQTKIDSVKNKLWVDVGFWGGVVPSSIKQLPELLEAGVFGVKSFLVHSGIDEFPMMQESDLNQAMPIVTKYDVPYLIHAELDGHEGDDVKIDHTYNSFLASRPKSFENNAIAMMFELCKRHQTKTHIVHLSSADMLGEIEKLKEEGLPLTVESCPHYLILKAEMIEDGKTLFKCCPPIREEQNRLHLWQALQNQVIDFVVSDHSPCTVGLKKLDEGNFGSAWGGISSLQFGLALMWTEMQQFGLGLQDLSRLMSEKTSQFIGLGKRKGKIAVGYDADIVVWDPQAEFKISSENIYYKNKFTPYEGRKVMGKVHQTYSKGQLVYDNGKFFGPSGTYLLRK